MRFIQSYPLYSLSTLFSLRVHCSKKMEGCKWEGELRFLKDHEKECEWAILDC